MSIYDDKNELSFYDGVSEEAKARYYQMDEFCNMLAGKQVAKGLPSQAVFELTPLCNLSCKMCFVRLSKNKMDSMGKLMTAAQWGDIVRQTADMGVYLVLITGGEPFTHPEFVDIYTNIAKSGFRVILYTNGVMLNEEIIETLKKYPPNALYITIYGGSEETYEKLCGNGKAYNSVVKNIKTLKDILKNIPIVLRTTVVKDNVNDIADIRKFAEQMNMKFVLGLGLLKPVRGAECRDIDKIRLSPEEIVALKKNILSSVEDKKTYDISKRQVEIYEENLLKYDGKTAAASDQERMLKCIAAKLIYTISWDGKMLPCQVFSAPYTFPLKNGLKCAWDELQSLKCNIKIPLRCIRCKRRHYCGTCPSAVQAESGTFADDEPYECMESYD